MTLYTVDAEFTGWEEPQAVVRRNGVFVSGHSTREQAMEAVEALGGKRPALYRGEHRLPYASQQQGRDLTFNEIGRRFLGMTGRGYRMTPEQQNSGPGHGRLPYEFLVHSPDSGATNWTAFHNLDELLAWAAAYNIGIAPNPPVPGEHFRVHLPTTLDYVLPLRQQ